VADETLRIELVDLLDRLCTPVAVRNRDLRVVYQNASHRQRFGEAGGQVCHAVYRGEAMPCADCPGTLGEKAPSVWETSSDLPRKGRCFSLEDGWAGHEDRPESARTEEATGFLGRFFESSGAAVFLESLDGTILAMNRAAERLYGYDRGEWLGRSVLDLIPEEAHPLLPDAVRQLEEGGAFFVEANQRRADGSLFRAQVEGFRLEGPERLALVTVRDVTAVAQERDALQARSREFEHLLQSVAHDLRSPLVGIKGYANLIDRALPAGDRGVRGHVLTLLRQTERMESLLEDLLEFARIGRTEELGLELNVAASARAAWQDLAGPVGSAGASLVISGPLPAVRMAPVRLTQVFTNLFANAVKYGRDGVPPRVEVSAPGRDQVPAGERAGNVCLQVRDNGVGVAPEEREEIFELFRQGSRVRREGAGLGLAIVRRIVESCGGRVWVEPEEGPGTTFCLTLPGAEREP